MEIKPYPYFRPLEKEDKSMFDQAFKNNPPEISEFTFTNLYSWREIYKFKVSLFGNLIIVCSATAKPLKFLDPIGTDNKKRAIENILRDSKGTFMRVPEETKMLFSADRRFRIEADLNNADYVYDMEELILLPGKRYDGKRNLIKKFKSSCEYEYISLNAANIKECLEFEEKWCSIKGCQSLEGLRNERKAIREMINNCSFFNLIAAGIKVKAEVSAVAIAEKLNPDTLVMHVLKADPNTAGLYQTILNEFLSHNRQGIKYVNLEQDLGIDGLRKSKLSYHPVNMINKYIISLA